MKIWLTTDTHFSHPKLVEYGRPLDFEKRIKKNLIAKIKSSDILIHLGDVCMGDHAQNNFWFQENLGCKTYLIRGNHDSQSITWYLKHGWDMVADRLDIETYGKIRCFTHAPVPWDGRFHINHHGHLHGLDTTRHTTSFQTSSLNQLLSLEENDYMPFLIK